MNFAQLKTRALSDAHREDYTAHVAGFVEQAEAYIFSSLESYGLEYALVEADRLEPNSPVYTLPQPFTAERYLFVNSLPLDKRDESAIYNLRASSDVIAYCMRPRHVIFAGTPAVDSTINLHYWGLPPRLSGETDTNTLMNDFPQLYIEATQIYVWKRAQNFEKVNEATTSVDRMIREINRKVKKQLGGARSSNPYNVQWRSSY